MKAARRTRTGGSPGTAADEPPGARLERVAAETFGWDTLHAYQLEAMESVMEGHDVLAALPTGAGKSAIYQVPALLLDGPALVVSPLLALQHDQADALRRVGLEAVVVNSLQSAAARRDVWRAIDSGQVHYVFLAPEQLGHEDVVDRLRRAQVALLAIDEAHCVSSWGHDFRPDYLRLAPVIQRLGAPVVALTATAAPPVRQDIVDRLGLRRPRQTVASFDRPNLQLAVERCTDPDERRSSVVSRAVALLERGTTGLVYTATRADSERLAAEIAQQGVSSMAYHAGLRTHRREEVHRAFSSGDAQVVVATSAFGMGIDKPDIRFVLHAATPESVDSYYQQIGRAGRDGAPAVAELFHRSEDLRLQAFLTAVSAPDEVLRAVSCALRGAPSPVRPADLVDRVEVSRAACLRAVNLLEQVGAVETAGRGRVVHRREVPTEEAVDAAVRRAEAHRQLIRSRVEMMSGYADTTGCRRQFLLGYFGEHLAEPCGACDNCLSGTATRRRSRNGRFSVQMPVTHAEWGSGVVMDVEEDRLTVLFEEVGYRTLALAAVEDHELLRPTR